MNGLNSVVEPYDKGHLEQNTVKHTFYMLTTLWDGVRMILNLGLEIKLHFIWIYEYIEVIYNTFASLWPLCKIILYETIDILYKIVQNYGNNDVFLLYISIEK